MAAKFLSTDEGLCDSIDNFVIIDTMSEGNHKTPEPIGDRITRVTSDEQEIKAFYNIPGSPERYQCLIDFYCGELINLSLDGFDSLSQEDKADFILLKTYLRRSWSNVKLERDHAAEVEKIIGGFAKHIRTWCEMRQRVDEIHPKEMAESLHTAGQLINQFQDEINAGEHTAITKVVAYRISKTITTLKSLLTETVAFYQGYDPLFDWWVTAPHNTLNTTLTSLLTTIRVKLLGIKLGDDDAILGDPIGLDGLQTELQAEMISYTPSELIQIAEKEYSWCEVELTKASKSLGFEENWKGALEHVKNLYEPPGSQPTFIKSLVSEGSEYVRKHNLVTVPPLCEEGIRVYMMGAAQQKVSPFFLGGPYLQVSYPTADMGHDDKRMALRGNNRYFSRATAFHEMIPGHRLQMYVAERNATARWRELFSTPFYVEGWALYWEMVFWERGDFFVSAEDKVGTLFWRMHRCVRIVFSLRFHLGEITAQEAVDMLVDRVGHERANAEGEVRRSLNGDYSPLYQAGYMLGALQIMRLRREVVDEGLMGEKEFHDRILEGGVMPIEMMRALFLEKELEHDFKSSWKFYDL